MRADEPQQMPTVGPAYTGDALVAVIQVSNDLGEPKNWIDVTLPSIPAREASYTQMQFKDSPHRYWRWSIREPQPVESPPKLTPEQAAPEMLDILRRQMDSDCDDLPCWLEIRDLLKRLDG